MRCQIGDSCYHPTIAQLFALNCIFSRMSIYEKFCIVTDFLEIELLYIREASWKQLLPLDASIEFFHTYSVCKIQSCRLQEIIHLHKGYFPWDVYHVMRKNLVKPLMIDSHWARLTVKNIFISQEKSTFLISHQKYFLWHRHFDLLVHDNVSNLRLQYTKGKLRKLATYNSLKSAEVLTRL